jgi:hypothetical protein
MEQEKYNPWKRVGEKLGGAQAGTFVFSKTDANGISTKHIVDDVAVNEALLPPPGSDNAILAGGVNVRVELDTDYTAKVVDGNRLRTCEFIIRTMVSPLQNGTYGHGTNRPDSGNPGAFGTPPKA